MSTPGLAGFETNDGESSKYAVSNQISEYPVSETVKRLAVKPTVSPSPGGNNGFGYQTLNGSCATQNLQNIIQNETTAYRDIVLEKLREDQLDIASTQYSATLTKLDRHDKWSNGTYSEVAYVDFDLNFITTDGTPLSLVFDTNHQDGNEVKGMQLSLADLPQSYDYEGNPIPSKTCQVSVLLYESYIMNTKYHTIVDTIVDSL